MYTVNIMDIDTPQDVAAADLRRHLAEHLDEVMRGATFRITRSGRPAAVLVPITGQTNKESTPC
jgi:prevent-host-death family protein